MRDSTLAASLPGTIPSASAHEARKRLPTRMRLCLVTRLTQPRPAAQAARKQGRTAKGPYYVDFRARTAASWGHAFVWYGKTSERAVEVAGLTPAGDTFTYVLGHLTWVPSETGASYGDLDPEYLTASYRVYLSEPDAKRVFAYIKKLQASSPVWNAETSNCTAFIGSIAEFYGTESASPLAASRELRQQPQGNEWRTPDGPPVVGVVSALGLAVSQYPLSSRASEARPGTHNHRGSLAKTRSQQPRTTTSPWGYSDERKHSRGEPGLQDDTDIATRTLRSRPALLRQ